MKIIINGIKQLQLKVHLTLLRLRLKLTKRSLYVKMRCSVCQYFLFNTWSKIEKEALHLPVYCVFNLI